MPAAGVAHVGEASPAVAHNVHVVVVAVVGDELDARSLLLDVQHRLRYHCPLLAVKCFVYPVG